MAMLNQVRRRWAGRVAAGGVLGSVLGLLAGCGRPVAPAVPPPPTVGVTESRRMTVPVVVHAQRDDPRPGAGHAPGPGPRVPHRAALRRGGDGQEGAAPPGDRRGAVPGRPRVGAGRRCRGRRGRPQGRAVAGREVAAAQLDLDEAQLFLGQIEERRSRSLLTRNAGTREDLDKTEADRKRCEAQVEADRGHRDQAKADYDVGDPVGQGAARRRQGRRPRRRAEPGLLPDGRPDRRADRRGEGQGRQPRRPRPGGGELHRAGHDPAARPDGRRHPDQLALPRPGHRPDGRRPRRSA